MLAKFKKFALRGNVVDLAVGFTVGAAFTSIAKSLVSDVIMPPIGLLIGEADFEDFFLVLRAGESNMGPYLTLAEARQAGAVTLNYGVFVNHLVAFLLVAISMFFLIHVIMKIDDKLEKEFGIGAPGQGDPADKKCSYCLSTISYQATRCPACTSMLSTPQKLESEQD